MSLRNCVLYGEDGSKFDLNPTLFRLRDNSAESVHAALCLPRLKLNGYFRFPNLHWIHLLTDEHSSNFKARRFVEAEFQHEPQFGIYHFANYVFAESQSNNLHANISIMYRVNILRYFY